MHISDMLNPEKQSEPAYSPHPQAHIRTYNNGTTNVPRSTVTSPAAQLESLPSAHSYSYTFDAYNASTNSHVPPHTGNRHAYDVGTSTTSCTQPRKSTAEPTTYKPFGYGSTPSDYALTQSNASTSRTTMPVHCSSPMASHDRVSQNNNIAAFPQGRYAQSQGNNSLAAFATLAASTDSRDGIRQENSRWGSIDRHRDESTAWDRQALGKAYRESPFRRDSQPLSPRADFGSIMPCSSRRTVSVGSQTSRPNTPERGRQDVIAPRVQICTAFRGRTPSPTSTSSSSLPPTSPSAEVMSDSPSSDSGKADDDHKCSYTDSCETGSPLRKVVSHFFGRNKLATRKIPKHLWVYFCRKHYQRSRYRNPRGFACLQIQLVQTQINNLRLWGGVLDWTVKVRRREEMRSRTNTGGSPAVITPGSEVGHYADADMEAVGEQMAARAVTRRRVSGAGGSIPAHYLQYVGEHKSMEEVIALVEAIKQDMERHGGTFPDLELLPRVAGEGSSGEGDEESNDRGKGKRARVSKAKPSQVKKRRGTNASERGSATTSAAEQGNKGLQQQFGTYSISVVSVGSRNATVPIPAAIDDTHHTEESMVMRPKRKLGLRCEEVDVASSSIPEQAPTALVTRLRETPRSPTKRRRLSHEESQENLLQNQDQQTATPPASAPSVSRRTSLAAECTAPSTCLSYTRLEEVDAALESVRVTSARIAHHSVEQ